MKDYMKRAQINYTNKLKSKQWTHCNVVVPIKDKDKILTLARQLRKKDEQCDIDRPVDK